MRLKKGGEAWLSVPYIRCPFNNQSAAGIQQVYLVLSDSPNAVSVTPRRIRKLDKEILQISIGLRMCHRYFFLILNYFTARIRLRQGFLHYVSNEMFQMEGPEVYVRCLFSFSDA